MSWEAEMNFSAFHFFTLCYNLFIKLNWGVVMKTCAICKKSLGVLDVKYTTSDGYKVCWKCIREAGYGVNASFIDIKKQSLDDVKEHLHRNTQEAETVAKLYQDFATTRNLEGLIELDEKRQLFRLSGFSNLIKIFPIKSILSYEIVENGNTTTSGGLGRAALGAWAFGGTGAIVGAVTGKKKTISIVESFRIRLNLDNIDNPVIYIDLIKKPVKSNSNEYKQLLVKADKIISSLDILLKDTAEDLSKIETLTLSAADEIRKYKALLDDNIISQEEFDAKKKELLDL